MADNNNKWKDLFQLTVTILSTVVVTLVGFWLVEGRYYVDRAEVSDMIANEAPYNEDRNMILTTLQDRKEVDKTLVIAITELREAITELKVQIVRDGGD